MRKPTIKGMAAVVAWIVGLVLLSVVAVLVWGSWITPFERVAMRRAMTDIEALQRMQGSEADYESQILSAKNAISLCKGRAITEYDSRITMLIEMDLQDVILRKKILGLPDSDWRKPIMMKAISKEHQASFSMLRGVIK